MFKCNRGFLLALIGVLGVTVFAYAKQMVIEGDNIKRAMLKGSLHEVVIFTANGTLTREQSGATVTNWAAQTDITITLPSDPTGCTYTIAQVNTPPVDLIVDPTGTDNFIGITDEPGHSLTANGYAETITVKGIDATNWVVEAVYPAAANWVKE